MMDARAITKALAGRWQGHYGLCRCPAHADKTPSLKVRDDLRKTDAVDVHCFAGCGWQYIKAALSRQGLLPEFSPKRGSLELTAPRALIAPVAVAAAEGDDVKKRVELALKIWKVSQPLKATLGWRYFTEHRGLGISALGDLSNALRWHEGFCAVVAPMTDAVTSEPTGVHRIFLNPDGSKLERRMLGKQGVVRLSPDEDVTHGLGIVEGVEDGLAVLLSDWRPIWCATSSGAIARFPVLPSIEVLTIFRDRDDVGKRAAEACAERWTAAGREVFLT